MKDKPIESKNEKKALLNKEYYGLEPEMSLQNVQFAPPENQDLNEVKVEKEQ